MSKDNSGASSDDTVKVKDRLMFDIFGNTL